MRILSVTKSPKHKTYKFKLTPEEMARLDILAKEAGTSKDEFLQLLVDSAWKRRVTRATGIDDFVSVLEKCLDEKGKEK